LGLHPASQRISLAFVWQSSPSLGPGCRGPVAVLTTGSAASGPGCRGPVAVLTTGSAASHACRGLRRSSKPAIRPGRTSDIPLAPSTCGTSCCQNDNRSAAPGGARHPAARRLGARRRCDPSQRRPTKPALLHKLDLGRIGHVVERSSIVEQHSGGSYDDSNQGGVAERTQNKSRACHAF
jgi:hypothetical protein